MVNSQFSEGRGRWVCLRPARSKFQNKFQDIEGYTDGSVSWEEKEKKREAQGLLRLGLKITSPIFVNGQ